MSEISRGLLSMFVYVPVRPQTVVTSKFNPEISSLVVVSAKSLYIKKCLSFGSIIIGILVMCNILPPYFTTTEARLTTVRKKYMYVIIIIHTLYYESCKKYICYCYNICKKYVCYYYDTCKKYIML